MSAPDTTHTADQLGAIDAACSRNLQLITDWMEVASSMLGQPDKLSGKELNRAGELLLSAGTWLTERRNRAQVEARRAALSSEWKAAGFANPAARRDGAQA